MLSQEDIQHALHASRVVPLPVASAHGPLGLEHLAEAVARLKANDSSGQVKVRRPIALSVETWEKLNDLARTSAHGDSHPVTASDVAAAILEQAVLP